MARVEANELEAAVLDVLARAATGKGSTPGYLTAYQILNRLPDAIQVRLRQEYGSSGKGGGQPFGPASRVAQVAAELNGVVHHYLDTGGLQFEVGQVNEVAAGYTLCAIFRVA